jgi:hypothetical protein
MGESDGTFACARRFVRYPEKIISGRDAVKSRCLLFPESENCLRVYEPTACIIRGQIRRLMARTP